MNSVLICFLNLCFCSIGELRAQYPDKAITLVHSHDSLLSTSNPPINPEAKAKLLALLQSLNITVKLNTRVNSLPRVENNDAIVTGSQQYSLSDGTTIQADLLFLAVGNAAPQGNIVSAVDEHNLVKVDSSFRVEGLRNVFCCGDANNHPETKLAYTGGLQAKHAAHSIERLEQGKQVKP